jgi:hypothetical protein
VEYATTVHGIKGSSRGIYAIAVGDMAENLEKAAKTGDFDFVCENNVHLLESMNKLIADIDQFVSEKSMATQKPTKDKPDVEMLKKLRIACEKYSMDEAETIMAEIDKYRYMNDDGLSDWLRENVKLTNFKNIREKLNKIGNEETI